MPVDASIDFQTPIAPIVHPKMNSGKESVTNAEFGMRSAECATSPSRQRHPQITLIAQISFLPSASSAKSADKTSCAEPARQVRPFPMRNSDCGTRMIAENNKSLPGLSVEQGQMGDGSAPGSLSHADIRRAPFGGCQLPDAILHGKRSLRPRGRAVQCLAAAGFRVRLFSLLGPMVAPPACKPGQDTPAIFISRLDH
jgi:hypothetical protein